MPSAASSPELTYAQRIERLRAEADEVQRQIRRLSNGRLLLFALALVVLLQASASSILFWFVALSALVLFFALVHQQRRARRRYNELLVRIQLCRDGIARCRRDWELIPIVLPAIGDTDHPYAGDLDLFGRPALSQLLGPVSTLHGKRALRHWLLQPAAPETVRARQLAVQALAPNVEQREALAAAARHALTGQSRLDHFLSWVADTTRPRPNIATNILAHLIPAAIWTLIVAQVTGVFERAWWLLPLTASVAFSSVTLRPLYRAFDAAFSRDPASLAYADAFEIAQQIPPDAPLLQQLHDQLHTGAAPAGTQIRRLERIMLLADVRHSGTASILLELFFQWSFHVWRRLRAWQDEVRDDVLSWFAALGDIKALCALATLAHDQPDWCFPDINAQTDRIIATAIGHPMLENERRVTNDISIGPPGTFLFVTGSNMAGKSTLLRAVGVNTVLAQAGAPVCARSYSTPPLRLCTSISVRDSLAGGLSLYMAQLRRIRQILDAAAETSDTLCCYLLDEILSGTNSTDRTTAVRAIVHHLLDQPAIGALATHDRALAEDERIRNAGVAIHFRETIDESGAMSFDYRIRPGVVQTSNAIALMRLMGIQLK